MVEKTITLDEEEIEKMLKKHLKIKGNVCFYLNGGWVNPKQIEVRYTEK